jgi:hypothetical protein
MIVMIETRDGTRPRMRLTRCDGGIFCLIFSLAGNGIACLTRMCIFVFC